MSELKNLKVNALQSATYDTALQMFLRLVSFVLNAFIVRHVSSAVFAIMTVRLNLLYATGLLLSREAFRRSALGCKSPKDIRRIVNLIWMGAVLSLPISLVGWLAWVHLMETPPQDVTTHYYPGVFLVILSVIVEVCTESPYIMAELHFWAKQKVMIEGAMQLTRAFLLAVGVYLWPDKAVLVYGCSHLTGSLIYCLAYYGMFVRALRSKGKAKTMLLGSFRSLFVIFTEGRTLPEVDPEMWRVSASFLKQGILKEVLTEGEMYLMNFLPLISLREQGIYQVVSNLGSLAARIVFRSVEAAAYKFFVQSLARGVPIEDQEKLSMAEVSKALHSLLKNLTHLSLFIVTFGWSYSHALLYLYGGSSLSSSGYGLLRSQCVYVIFLALNGILEAFTFATMSDAQLQNHNKNLIFFSVVYIGVTGVAVTFFGVYGFVVGNCVNMVLRISHGARHMKALYAGSGFNPLGAVVVSRNAFLTLLKAFVSSVFSEVFIYNKSFLGHLILGVMVGLATVFSLRKDLEEIIVFVFTSVDKLYIKYSLCPKMNTRYSFPLLNSFDKVLSR